MPLYEFTCCGERWTELFPRPVSGASSPCPRCGAAARRVMSSFSVLGRAGAGPDRSRWPRSWEATGGGDPEVVTAWHRAIEGRTKLEERYPELGPGPQSPVVSHEGPRVVTAANLAAEQAGAAGARGHAHHHGHGHGPPYHAAAPRPVEGGESG